MVNVAKCTIHGSYGSYLGKKNLYDIKAGLLRTTPDQTVATPLLGKIEDGENPLSQAQNRPMGAT